MECYPNVLYIYRGGISQNLRIFLQLDIRSRLRQITSIFFRLLLSMTNVDKPKDRDTQEEENMFFKLYCILSQSFIPISFIREYHIYIEH